MNHMVQSPTFIHMCYTGWSVSLSNCCFLVEWFMFLYVFYVMLTSNKVSHKGYKATRNIFIEHFYVVMYLLLELYFHWIPLNVPLFINLQYLRNAKRKSLHVRVKQMGNYDSSNVSMKKAGDLHKVLTSFLCFSRSLIFFSYTSGSQVLDGVFSTALPDCKFMKKKINNNKINQFYNTKLQLCICSQIPVLCTKSTQKC